MSHDVMITHTLTSSQTVGPFFHDCLLRADMRMNVLAGPETSGERIRLEGRVSDGDGQPVPDAMIEIWQANSHGRYHHPVDSRDLPLEPSFSGFGRSATDAEGIYWFETVKPGPVPFPSGGLQAPHICVTVFARGLLNHLSTRVYFADEPANAEDAILLHVPAERRATLLAPRSTVGATVVYRFDIVLQAGVETAFFQYR